jgi:hypothetical protein
VARLEKTLTLEERAHTGVGVEVLIVPPLHPLAATVEALQKPTPIPAGCHIAGVLASTEAKVAGVRCASYRNPGGRPHSSVLLSGAEAPAPILNNRDFNEVHKVQRTRLQTVVGIPN